MTVRKPKLRPLPKSVPATSNYSDVFKRTKKTDSALVGPVQRFLVARAEASTDYADRATAIHPSDLSTDKWCPRKSYYKLTGETVSDDQRRSEFTEAIFAEGHSIHDKWQLWLWQLGELHGVFECIACGWKEWAKAPTQCPECGAAAHDDNGVLFLRYREVPLRNDEYNISGSADGLTDELLEIKSVGPGSVRYGNPDLFNRYAAGEYTLDQLWRSLRRPFLSHRKQGMLYAWLHGREMIRYIYEWKPTQALKEFEVRLDMDIVQPMLEQCKDVLWFVSEGRPPARPARATAPSCSFCSDCPYKTTCWSSNAPTPSTDTVPLRRRRRPAQ